MNSQKGYTLNELLVCIVLLTVVGVLIIAAFTVTWSLTTTLKVLGVIALILLIFRLL